MRKKRRIFGLPESHDVVNNREIPDILVRKVCHFLEFYKVFKSIYRPIIIFFKDQNSWKPCNTIFLLKHAISIGETIFSQSHPLHYTATY